jgi:hypothetical protein
VRQIDVRPDGRILSIYLFVGASDFPKPDSTFRSDALARKAQFLNPGQIASFGYFA